jgi:glucan phosphoethanolaminetransferase (alkaline phosphatase superfamily)
LLKEAAMNGPVVSPRRLLQMGAWMGLAYGLLEGLGFSVLRLLPWVMSPVNGTSAYILWIAPIYYAAIFVVVAGGFVALARCFRRVAWDVALVFVLVALAGFLACSFPGRFVMNYASLIVGLGLSVQVSLRQYRKHRAAWSRVMVRTLPPLAIAVLIIAVGTIGMQQLREAVALARLPVVAGGAAPNVLLLVMDTQRADHLSSYGYHRPTSPRLDQLATEGVLFEHAHANSSWTVPSHASLMTGRFVWEHRTGDPWHPFLDGRHATLAEVLQRAGYATGGFVANTLWAGRHTGLHRGFIRYED